MVFGSSGDPENGAGSPIEQIDDERPYVQPLIRGCCEGWGGGLSFARA